MVKVWRGGTEESFEFGQADGAYKSAGMLVLTRRKRDARKPEEYRVFEAGTWTVAEVYDRRGTLTQRIAST